MSLYLNTDAGEQYPLATVAGWGLVGEWADALDPDSYPETVHLWEHGWCQAVAALAAELDAAPPPHDRNAAHTLAALKETLAGIPGGAAVVVSDGMTADGVKEDRSGLVKKTVTDKTGKKTTVYVSPDSDPPGGSDGDPATPEHDPKLAAHAAGELDGLPAEVTRNPGLMARLGDALLTVAAKVNLAAIRNNERILAAVSIAEALFDTPDDLKKLGYNPTTLAGGEGAPTTNDPMRGATGVSTHLACTIASHVLGRLSVAARKWLGGAKSEADGSPDWAGLAEVVAQVFAAVNESLGMDGAPDAAAVEKVLRETFG